MSEDFEQYLDEFREKTKQDEKELLKKLSDILEYLSKEPNISFDLHRDIRQIQDRAEEIVAYLSTKHGETEDNELRTIKELEIEDQYGNYIDAEIEAWVEGEIKMEVIG